MNEYIKILMSGALMMAMCACHDDSNGPDTPTQGKPEPHLHDIAEALGKPLTDDLFFSQGAVLSRKTNVMQWFDIAPSGRIYYSQNNSAAEAVIGRAPGPNESAWNIDHAMLLSYFGHGDTIDVEENVGGKTYIWVQSNATQKNGGKTYWGSLSVSRLEFAPGAKYEHCAGETFFFTGHSGLITDIDFDNRRFMAGTFVGADFIVTVFDLDEMLALPYKDITITTTIAGAPYTRTVRAHDLADLTPLGQFRTRNGAPNKETDVLSYDHQGHAIYGDYVYVYEGNTVAVDGGHTSKAYVTAFDYNGNIAMPRTEVKAANDRDAWIATGWCDAGWLEPEGMVARADGIYIGLSSKHVDSNIPRRSHILKYQCDLCRK